MDVAVERSRHNQLDADWLSEIERRGPEEKLIQAWETDVADVTPETLDERLAGLATTVCRTFGTPPRRSTMPGKRIKDVRF